MEKQKLDGDRSLAWGAIEAGVSVITGYPGSPGTGTFNALAAAAEAFGHQAEWCVNERVALDIAAGVSQGGRRALVCLKSVGMNVALDTLMVLNMTGVHAGLVILMGDDPGAWGSQNEQDTRSLAPLAEIPMLEPATPGEGREMMRWAFDFSESLRTVVVLRITRSFCARQEDLPPLAPPTGKPSLPPDREPMRWISALRTTVANHRRLHRTLGKAANRFEGLPHNRLEGSGPYGILAGGFVYTKLRDALAGADASDTTVLKLSTIYPLPRGLITRFLESCEVVLILEEVDPYLEDAIKAVGYDIGVNPDIRGKRTGHVNWEGELFRWHIQTALDAYLPGFAPANRYTEEEWQKERPSRKDHCAGCPYVGILRAFREEAADLGQNPFVAGDPGCIVMALDQLDTKLCMGSSIGVAAGLRKAQVGERTVAIFGDSAFYHSAINALIHARATGADLLALVLDNGGAVTTGGQTTPDRGFSPSDPTGAAIGIRDLAAACGVDRIWSIGETDGEDRLRHVFRGALSTDGLGLVIVRKPCKLLR